MAEGLDHAVAAPIGRRVAPAGKRRRRSLQSRILWTVSSLVSVLLALDAINALRHERAAQFSTLAERAGMLATVQADALAAALWDFNDHQAQAVLDALRLDPDFESAIVRNEQGAVILARGAAGAGPKSLTVERPIVHLDQAEPRVLGRLELTVGTSRMISAIRQEIQLRLLLFLPLLVLVLAVIHATFKQIATPLGGMAQTLSRLAGGERGVPVPALDRPDEIGDMARAIQVFKQQAEELERLRQIEDRLAAEERLRIRAAVDSSTDAVVITDALGQLIYVNPACRRLLALPAAPAAASGDLFKRFVRPQDAVRLRRALRAAGTWHNEVLLRAGGDRLAQLHLRGDAIRAADGRPLGFIVLATDVSDRRAAEARIQFLAHHDPLTSLPNRAALQTRLVAALAECGPAGRAGALLLLDLDRFKEVNDTIGHPAGDALLQAVTERLRSVLRVQETAARLGGDEFAILLPTIGEAEAACALAERLIATLAKPFLIDGHEIFSGTSIGITLFPRDGATPERLLQTADMALYYAKARGRGAYSLFSPAMEQDAQRRKDLAGAMRQSLQHGAFELHYQPQVGLPGQALIGLEALLRWPSVGGQQVGPADLIPIAEDTGLIVELGAWVLGQACAQMRQWLAAGRAPERIAINVSPIQFRDGLPEQIEAALRRADLAPERLEIEVTESVLLKDTDAVARLFGQLREIGVGLALDDFGTGYASISYLRRFPFNKIKIDRSFVHELGVQADGAALVGGLIKLGHSLGMTVTAEGVETPAQLEHLCRLDCDEAQGYLFGQPLPPAGLDPERLPAIAKPLAPATAWLTL